jgi:hypothetical protein
MQYIPCSYRYLLAMVIILLAFPFVSGFIMSSRIKNNRYSLEPVNDMAPKIAIPMHKTLVIDSYKDGLNVYAWWNNTADTMFSYDLEKIQNNTYYFQQKLSGDSFSILYLPYLKNFIEAQPNPEEAARKKIGTIKTTISLLGKAPEKMIIKGGDIQISPIANTLPIRYVVEQGSLSLGIFRENSGHYYSLSLRYPHLPIGNNQQPDWQNKIISPATIHLANNTSLSIKDGYDVEQTVVIASANSFINIDHPNAHEQIKWQLSDSTYIHCSKIQEAWFHENFPNTKLIFTTNERGPF